MHPPRSLLRHGRPAAANVDRWQTCPNMSDPRLLRKGTATRSSASRRRRKAASQSLSLVAGCLGRTAVGASLGMGWYVGRWREAPWTVRPCQVAEAGAAPPSPTTRSVAWVALARLKTIARSPDRTTSYHTAPQTSIPDPTVDPAHARVPLSHMAAFSARRGGGRGDGERPVEWRDRLLSIATIRRLAPTWGLGAGRRALSPRGRRLRCPRAAGSRRFVAAVVSTLSIHERSAAGRCSRLEAMLRAKGEGAGEVLELHVPVAPPLRRLSVPAHRHPNATKRQESKTARNGAQGCSDLNCHLRSGRWLQRRRRRVRRYGGRRVRPRQPGRSAGQIVRTASNAS